MLGYLYEWLRNLAFYLVLVTAVLHTLPSSAYKKYIRFFTGLVLIMMLVSPVLNLFGLGHKFTEIYQGYNFEENMEEIEKKIEETEEKIHQESGGGIEVEEIVIGP